MLALKSAGLRRDCRTKARAVRCVRGCGGRGHSFTAEHFSNQFVSGDCFATLALRDRFEKDGFELGINLERVLRLVREEGNLSAFGQFTLENDLAVNNPS